jgi:hypothetical protein
VVVFPPTTAKRRNHSSSSSVNASWEHFDDASCGKNHDTKEDQTMDDQQEKTIYQLLKKES